MRLLILGGTLYLGRHTVEAARARGHEAIAAGLTYRPLADTLRDTLAWTRTLPPGPRAPKTIGVTIPAAMTREREAELHLAWRERGVDAGGERAMAGRRGGTVR